MVPKNKKYLVKQITFEGPCKDALTVQVTYMLSYFFDIFYLIKYNYMSTVLNTIILTTN